MTDNLIAITCFRQACAYISDNVKPVNIEYDKKKRVMIFFFNKQDTNYVWNKWKNGEYHLEFDS